MSRCFFLAMASICSISMGMATLFQRDKSVISRHIGNIFKDGELTRDSVVANFATTAADGKTYQLASKIGLS